jgi:hypothetical protein
MSLPVTSSLQFWFPADTLGLSNGATVTSWADQSGNANNATVTAGTATFHTAQINGKPAVTFSSSKFSLANAISSSGQHTVFAVYKLSSTSKGCLVGGPFGGYTYWFGASSLMQGADSSGLAQLATGTAAVSTAAWHQSDLVFSGAGSSPGTIGVFRLDRAADATQGLLTSGNNPTEPTVIGYNGGTGGEFFAGQLAELVYYNRNLTTTEVTQMESYLNTKYFVAGGLLVNAGMVGGMRPLMLGGCNG